MHRLNLLQNKKFNVNKMIWIWIITGLNKVLNIVENGAQLQSKQDNNIRIDQFLSFVHDTHKSYWWK